MLLKTREEMKGKKKSHEICKSIKNLIEIKGLHLFGENTCLVELKKY